jgi:hypothetical protein
MLFGGGILSLALLALWIYCILDVISTDDALVRNLPKLVWLLIVILIPDVGSVAWLLLGRPEHAGFRPGDTTYRPSRRPMGPEDSPEFMSSVDDKSDQLRRWEEDLKRREDELRKKEQGD